MSHGALSKEAHETLAIGMNRIKGASCSGCLLYTSDAADE